MMAFQTMEPLGWPPIRPNGPKQPWAGPHGFSTSGGFTLVEVVVSSSIIAFALAASLKGWSQSQALVQQAQERQVLLTALEQDLQRQQGLVIRTLKTNPPWACEITLPALQQKLQALEHQLPEDVERQWFIQDQQLGIRYRAPTMEASRERVLALGGGSACE